MTIIMLISLSVSVILVENLILERCYGMQRFPWMSRNKRRAAENGLLMLGMMVLSMTAALIVRAVLRENAQTDAWCAAAFVVVLLPVMGVPVWRLPRHDRRMIRIVVCGVNTVLLGLWLMAAPGGFDTMGAGIMLLASLGAVVIFVLTGLLFESLHQRLRLCDCPRSFRGIPLEFITAALLLMALWGLM